MAEPAQQQAYRDARAPQQGIVGPEQHNSKRQKDQPRQHRQHHPQQGKADQRPAGDAARQRTLDVAAPNATRLVRMLYHYAYCTNRCPLPHLKGSSKNASLGLKRPVGECFELDGNMRTQWIDALNEVDVDDAAIVHA